MARSRNHGEWSHLVAKLGKAPANLGVDIDGYEKAHGKITESRGMVASPSKIVKEPTERTGEEPV
jgi:hypothetical protein